MSIGHFGVKTIIYVNTLIMKGIKVIFGALAAASLLFSVNATAQENNNRDENGKVVRGSYETNKAFDNIFIGIGAGYNSGIWGLGKNGNTTGSTKWGTNYPINFQGIGGLGVDVFVGKWFTPAIGTRIGYMGLSNHTGNKFSTTPNQHYIHADFIWNMFNSFAGYKETRVWNLNPYFTTGVLGYKATGTTKYDWEYAAGFGLLNTWRLSSRVGLFLDLTALVAHSRQYPGASKLSPKRFFFPLSANFGLQFNLGKTNFDRHSTITPVVIPVPFTTEQYNALKDKVAALEKENASLKNKIAALEKEVAPLRSLVNGQTYLYENGKFTAVDVKAGAPVSIYFDMGSAKLSAREKAHLEYFTNNIATADTKVEVNGYADKATGSAKTNQALSEKRAKAVVDLLKKAGVAESNIECKANGGVDNFGKPAYKNRCVTIEIK